ncbi:hypothetical protein EmuJ_000566300 [Echinococcus multilocularis]|uniref:Uncharacterized protein n=1 Tax=Echinococcus multilocularis TaxID=6211 RepID=A0A068Y508_ECHMU|nr:hypothetical protein EmuJ_000566300 [Echinococcus multilocularis]
MITRCLNEACGDVDETLARSLKQNDNLNRTAIDLVGTSSVKLRARVDLIPEELKAALNEKGDHLTYEEMLRVLQVLQRVVDLNEAVSVRNESKIMPILLAADAHWENVEESNGEVCRL